jgi:hypothetical protein
MMQSLSAALGTDAEVIKCIVMLGCTLVMMWPQRHNGLFYWSMRAGFTLAVAMCFPRFRATVTAAAARSMAALRLRGANGEPVVGRATVGQAQDQGLTPMTRIERHRPIDAWRWEDAGDVIVITVQLPPASLDRDVGGTVLPPAATAKIMPQDFTLTISTSRSDHVLEVKKLFNAVDPRKSGTAVDTNTGMVTLRLEKWFDSTPWKTLVDEGKHPLASMDLDARTSNGTFESSD